MIERFFIGDKEFRPLEFTANCTMHGKPQRHSMYRQITRIYTALPSEPRKPQIGS